MNKPQANQPNASRAALALAWAAALAVGGGFACGVVISRYGEYGSVLLWPLGALGGFVAFRLSPSPNRLVTASVAAACFVALALAEVYWIRWNWSFVGEPRPESWGDAVRLIPLFLQRFTITVGIAAMFAVFGALSAFRQLTARGKRPVPEQ